MANQQLEMVAAWEREKEDQLARNFQLAQQHAQMNKDKLASLERYRLDYLRQTQTVSQTSIQINKLNQLQSFISKLDKACQQQMTVHSQAQMVVEQRKAQWLAQQRKRKAVEMLLEKKRLAKQAAEDRQEQALMDELSTQRYIRKQLNR